jgi:hypothetical protein
MAPYYNVPNWLGKRAASFGYGKKTSFEDSRGVPAPDSYKIESDFVGKKKIGVSFGFSREVWN